MYEINGDEVLIVKQKGRENTKTFRIVKSHYGFVNKAKCIETADKIIYQWYKFNFEKGGYEVDTENTKPIVVDEVEYTPINGKVEILKDDTE